MTFEQTERHLLKNGWSKARCSSCSGNPVLNFTNRKRPGETVQLLKRSKMFRLRIDGRRVYGSTLENIEHQYFMQ